MPSDDKPPVSRGFVGRRRAPAQAERVPPGQYVTLDFPILSAGPTPHTPLEEWSFALQHGRQRLAEWNWAQFTALPQTTVTADIHCVTKWSKLDTVWEGVSFDTLLHAAGLERAPTAYVMAYSDGGYTTNVPVADLADGKAMVAMKFNGEALAAGHGGPVRLVVPHLYFWKSAKWVRGLTFIEQDKPGFWESPRLPHVRRPVEGAALRGRLSRVRRPGSCGGSPRSPRSAAKAREPAGSACRSGGGPGMFRVNTWTCG